MDIQQIVKKNKLLIAIFIIALLVRIIFVFSMPVKLWDETIYLNLGKDLSHNFLSYSFSHGWSDFIPSGGDEAYSHPKAGFRAPLLPYLISFFYIFNLGFLTNFLMPLIGALSVILIYQLGKELFNQSVGLISSLFLTFIPLHVFYSGRVLTDVLFTFFVLLTFLIFWKGYEKSSKKHKVLFGVFLALTLLSRYTALWIIPIFLLYFLARDKSLNFLMDRYLWYSVLAFFITLIPWLIYGIFEYDNPLGAFIHGAKASAYWGGLQSWHFFFDYWWQMFSIVGFVFIISLIYILYKKEFFKKEIYLILIWFAFFLGMAIYMPHKEDRFILPIAPVIALISGYFIDKIKKYQKIIFIAIIIVSLISLSGQFYISHKNSYTNTNKCFLEANNFLKKVDKNSVIITDESSVVYYYTKIETRFYPNPWSYETLKHWKEGYSNKKVYVIFGDYIKKSEVEYNKIKEDLEKNLTKVFECSKDKGYSIVYEF